MTCGFVIDENDRPYSKSSGNYVPLPQMIEKYGAEIIRMWVASSDYREDVRMSEQTMARLTEAYRKIRNTARFIIAYEDFEFHKVHFALVDFCSVDMSAIYLDVLKDRLYVSAPDDPARRASQTALWTILTGMVRLMAPIITFTAEEIWELIRKDDMPESVHVALFPDDMPLAEDEKLLEKWGKLLEVRGAITKALEDARKAGLIGSSQEAFVILTAPSQDGWVKENSALIKELAIVSGLKVENGDGELSVKVEKSPGRKCLRCWNWGEDVGSHGSHEQICDRCADVLKRISAL
jgi:isoleucyl-tRNA synthetase